MSSSESKSLRDTVLDPIDRSSESIFGVLMAVTVAGSLSAATAGEQEIRTMLFAVLGCNLAWGLTDAVMYLVTTATEKSRKLMQLRQLREANDPAAARRMVANALPGAVADRLEDSTLEDLRRQLAALPLPDKALQGNDYAAAVGVFVVVVLITFPVVLPFMFIRDVPTAMRASNAIALVLLYANGHVLGQCSGHVPWRSGVVMALIGVGLIAVIMALGG